MEECREKLYKALHIEMSEEDLCRVTMLTIKALKQFLDRIEANIASIDYFEIDPEGPRLIVRLKKPLNGIEEVYVDASPDGVELSLEMQVSKNLDKERFEDELADVIENTPEFSGVEEYDLSYDPETGRLNLLFVARLISELPSIKNIREFVERAIVSSLG